MSTDLHDDRCATRKGGACNCASAAFTVDHVALVEQPPDPNCTVKPNYDSMRNRAMRNKLLSEGAIDICTCEREGPYYVLTVFVDDVDYCDSKTESYVWSIGRRRLDGKVLASLSPDLYQNPDFECLWLR